MDSLNINRKYFQTFLTTENYLTLLTEDVFIIRYLPGRTAVSLSFYPGIISKNGKKIANHSDDHLEISGMNLDGCYKNPDITEKISFLFNSEPSSENIFKMNILVLAIELLSFCQRKYLENEEAILLSLRFRNTSNYCDKTVYLLN